MASSNSYRHTYTKSSKFVMFTDEVNGCQGETQMMASRKVITVKNTCTDHHNGSSQSHSSSKCNVIKMGSRGEVHEDACPSEGSPRQTSRVDYRGVNYSTRARKDSKTKDGQTEAYGARQSEEKERKIKINVLSGESKGKKYSSTFKKDLHMENDSSETFGARVAPKQTRTVNTDSDIQRQTEDVRLSDSQREKNPVSSENPDNDAKPSAQLSDPDHTGSQCRSSSTSDLNKNLCSGSKPPIHRNGKLKTTRKTDSPAKRDGLLLQNPTEFQKRLIKDASLKLATNTSTSSKILDRSSASNPGKGRRTNASRGGNYQHGDEGEDAGVMNGAGKDGQMRRVYSDDSDCESTGRATESPENGDSEGRRGAASGEESQIHDDLVLSFKSMNLKEVPPEVNKCISAQELILDHNLLDCLPGSLCVYLTNLVRLSLVGNDVEHLPAAIGQLSKLRELYLNENQLMSLPSTITHLSKLTHLNIVGNMIKALPPAFGELTSLERLDADENLLETLPDSFGDLLNLRGLEICNNKLHSLPESFGCLKSLHTINISCNQIEVMPASFSNLPNVTSLDLSENGLALLPTEFKSHGVIQRFYCETNGINVLPAWFGNMPELLELSMRDNQLPEAPIPESFGHNSHQLKTLDLAGNFMTSIPESLGRLQSLENIHLGSVIDELERRAFQNGNWLALLPETFGHLINLRHARLEENQLERLPENFGDLVHLETLDLGQNRLRRLPDSFCHLRSLHSCFLSKNAMQKLPDDFGNLSSLRDLHLDNNLVSELPASFSLLTQLRTLDLFNNELSEVPGCIENMTKLERLDLMENKLRLKLDDIPNIGFAPKYAERNPALKQNWRGRPRSDVDPNFKKNIKKVNLSSDEEQEEEEESGDLDDSNPVIEQAMRKRTSLWQAHGGPSAREVYIRPYSLPETASLQSATRLQSKPGIPSSNLDDEDPEFNHRENSVSSSAGQSSSLTSDAEDWDKELEGTSAGVTAVYTPQVVFTKSWPAVTESCAFLPSDVHPDPYYKRSASRGVEEGQFDDADE